MSKLTNLTSTTISVITGLLAAYGRMSSLLSRMPSFRPWWMISIYAISAVCLIGSAIPGTSRTGATLAFAGSALVLTPTLYFWLLILEQKLGLVHLKTTYRLMAMHANWFDRLRPFIDLPISVLLLICSMLSLYFGAYALVSESRSVPA